MVVPIRTLWAFIIGMMLFLVPFSVNAADTKLYYNNFSSLNLDGTINEGEYSTTFDVPDHLDKQNVFITVSWSHNGTHLAMGIVGKLTGWVGFGMNEPGKGMAGSDMVIASVEGSTVTVGDYHATGNVPPTQDTNQFPIDAAGKEENGQTTIEMVIPLTSDDTEGQDHNWKVGGTYGFFFAAHESSDTLTYHTWHSDLFTVEIASQGETPAQATVALGGSTGGNGETDYLSPILFWGFLTLLGIFIWRNGKFY